MQAGLEAAHVELQARLQEALKLHMVPRTPFTSNSPIDRTVELLENLMEVMHLIAHQLSLSSSCLALSCMSRIHQWSIRCSGITRATPVQQVSVLMTHVKLQAATMLLNVLADSCSVSPCKLLGSSAMSASCCASPRHMRAVQRSSGLD